MPVLPHYLRPLFAALGGIGLGIGGTLAQNEHQKTLAVAMLGVGLVLVVLARIFPSRSTARSNLRSLLADQPLMEQFFETLRGVIELHRRELSKEVHEATKLTKRDEQIAGESVQDIYDQTAFHADELTEYCATVVAQEIQRAEHFETVLRDQVAFVSELISATQSHLAEQAESARSALLSSRQIVKCSEDIRELSTAVHLLSINSKIEAAHAGEHGAGFAVVAANLTELTKSVEETNSNVYRLGEELGELIPSIAHGAEEMANRSEEHSVMAKTHLSDLSVAFDDARNSVRTVLETLEESQARASRIREKASALVTHLQFQERVTKVLAAADDHAVEMADALVHLMQLLNSGQLTRSDLQRVLRLPDRPEPNQGPAEPRVTLPEADAAPAPVDVDFF